MSGGIAVTPVTVGGLPVTPIVTASQVGSDGSSTVQADLDAAEANIATNTANIAANTSALAARPKVIGQSGVPFVLVSSGTMGNNGALSGITAVATTYLRAYVYLPANAIVTGSAAGWYYAVFSSTTAATVYNNTYSGSGAPVIPTSPTAFATTGPGAFTQTTSEVAAYTVSVPGNAMGVEGAVECKSLWSCNSSAGTKTTRVRFGGPSGTILTANGGTTITAVQIVSEVQNRGVANRQVCAPGTLQLGSAAVAPSYLSVDTTAAVDVVFSVQLSSAADTLTLERRSVRLAPAP